MKTVSIQTAKPYSVFIGPGLFSEVGAEVRKLGGVSKAAVISDSTVWPLYGQAVEDNLASVGMETCRFVFPSGESSKNGLTYLNILNFLAEQHLTRTDLIVALGGGVVGDMAGFAAATYLRGLRFIQLPTTLLAAVDSSVGGKTAIDLPAGKNLAGAFCQPSLVLCDTDALRSLPEEIFRDGCAEVIKYGVLYDPDLFACLLESGLEFDRERVIARCVALKGQVVAEDEFDNGQRMKLNLGHTFGHGIEAASDFSVSHGRAVSTGMAIVARASAALGICGPEVRDSILEILAKFGLPTATHYGADALLPAVLGDKKRFGATVNLIVPEKIGACAIRPTPVTALGAFLEMGLS